MRALDLFSGIGGLSIGFRRAGFEVLGVELDQRRVNTYKLNVGPAIAADARKMSFGGLKADVIIAGPPCRPYSEATPLFKRGPRHPEFGLDMEVLRAVSAVRPLAVVVEEVPEWKPQTIVGGLKGLGYDVAFRLVKFSDYGVPTTRSRWIVVALRGGDAGQAFRALDRMREVPPRPIDVLSDLPPEPCASAACQYNGRTIYDHITYSINSRLREVVPLIPPGLSLVTAHERGLIDASKYVKDITKKHRYWLYRVPTDKPMKVVPHPRRSMVLHPLHNRMLTVRELARLMTYPDDFRLTAFMTAEEAMRAITDSVPPRFSQKLAQTVGQVLG